MNIVGYIYQADIYQADIYCDGVCVLTTMWPEWDDPAAKTETALDAAALVLKLDREDEHSFDSSEFPKVIFSNGVHDECTKESGCTMRCAECHEELGNGCWLKMVKLRWQYCGSGNDISDQPLYAEQDADEIRAWDDDFCMVAMVRDGKKWRIEGSDRVIDLPDYDLRFDSPQDVMEHVTRNDTDIIYKFED